MTVAEWREKSDRICANIFASVAFKKAKTVLAYFHFRQEPDLSPLFTNSLNNSPKTWAFPRCVDKSLQWCIWSPNDPVKIGAYGITEPHPDASTITPTQVDLILVPSLACDYQKYRLGYGGGYYDRLLSSPEWEHKLTIGIVFEFSYLPQLPVESWDKRLQGVCTETGLLI
jgi:5-formyltetrahydrofolate cyclo-ligase